MNKLVFLLSIVLGLASCSSDSPNDENELPSGIMQPIYNNGDENQEELTLFPEVERQEMPPNMN